MFDKSVGYNSKNESPLRHSPKRGKIETYSSNITQVKPNEESYYYHSQNQAQASFKSHHHSSTDKELVIANLM